MNVSHSFRRAYALTALAAFTVAPSFAAVFDTSSGTDWFDGTNYDPIGVPTAATDVDIFSTAGVAAEINSAGALANNLDLGASDWPGSLVVGTSGTLDVTNVLTLVPAANGNQTSSLVNNGVMSLGSSFKTTGISTVENHGTLTASGMILSASNADAQTNLTNTGTIDLGSSGWLHLCVKGTVATEFTMLGGSVTAKRLNLHADRKVNLNLYGGSISVSNMTDPSADFLIDVQGDGELILNGNATSSLNTWIAAGYIFTSGSGGVLAVYDSGTNKTRLYADATAPSPNPAGFDTAPLALDATTVVMWATEGSDESGVVEYLFSETSGNPGGTSSGWQSSPYYEDAGLTEGLEYSYTVSMRDAVGNVGTASAVSTVLATPPPPATAMQSGGWNDPATWGGTLPISESDVTIPMGLTVTLVGDQECGSVTVMGKLIADPAADCSLHCDWVMVMGAGSAFEVGSHVARYPHEFTLTLKGLISEEMTGGTHAVGSKFLVAMNGGVIDLHGPERVSWTKLSATSVAGATTLTLDEAVDWVAGEQIVITSTDTNWDHAEERTIASVSGDGLTVTLTQPLDYTHTGVTETHTRSTDGKSWSIDLKAEVGLLSRSVTIQGDSFSDIDGYGGHTMAMHHDGMAAGAFYAEGVEFYRMGQKALMGRYPVHWHLMTDQAQGQYVRNSSIHHSFNRAVTIHGTDYVTVEDNFCYDHIGHGIFFENGAERFNTIKGNVVLLSKRPEPGEELTPSDNQLNEQQNRTPASFWITNPNNTIEDNIAAGTHGTGFWFIFPKIPLEPARSLPYYAGAEPSKEPLGLFDRNTAHSCMSGLDINDELKSDHSIKANGAWDNDGPFYFNDCAWFSNDIALYAGTGKNSDNRKDNVVYYNNILADNEFSLMFATYHKVEESMLIADSGHGNLLGGTTTMYRVYDGAGRMSNNHMVGWDAANANLLQNPGASTKHPNHRFSGFTWDHAGLPRNVQPVFDHPSPGQWSQVIHDVDGSVGGLVGSSIISNHPFMVMGNETQPAEWANNLVSPNRYAHLRLLYESTKPNVTVLRSKVGTKTEGLVYLGDLTNHHHQLALVVNDDVLYTYHYETMPVGNLITIHFDDTEIGDAVLVCIKEFGKLAGLSAPGVAHASLASLQASSSTGHYIEPNGDLYLRPVATQHFYNEYSVTWTGSLTLPVVDSDLDGVSDVDEYNAGTEPFGLPVANAQSITLDEDGALSLTLSGTDPENDPLSFVVTTQPANGTLSGSGANLTYTPDPDFNGSDSFTFSVDDGSLTNSATVWITVNAVEDAPVALAQSVSVDEDSSLAITLTGSDADGDSLTYALTTLPVNGSLSGTAPNLTYTPNADYNGSDSFTFTVNDGAEDSVAATVSIAVNAVNDTPVADAQSVAVNEDGSLAITLSGSDTDGDSLSYAVVMPPANGSLSGAAPNLTYTPDLNYAGTDSFTFTVNDGTEDSFAATVSIAVNSVNDAPSFESDPIVGADAQQNSAYVGSLSATDVDGDTLSYSKLSGPDWLVVASDGSLSGTPLIEDIGANSWTVEVSDGNGATAQATLNITVLIDPNPAIRVTEYYLSAGDFTGTSTTLTLDQDLADDYFILVRGSRDGDGVSMPDNDYARLAAVPGGKGDLPDSGALNQVTLQRQAADLNWEGVVTVIECQNSASASGFKLVDALVTNMTTLSGTVSTAAWTDINQVVLFGGYRGGGVEMFGAPTSRQQGTSCYTRLYPSGSDTLNWSRDAGGETLFDATMTTFVVEWGSDWTVQHVNVAGSAGGGGANSTNEYATAAISTVSRDNTWLWATGTRVDSGIGDCAEACLVTLGDGVTQNSSESTVAIGSEYTDAYDFDIYVLTHPDIAVDHRFKVDGDSTSADLPVAVDIAAAGARFGWLYNGCNGTGGGFPRPRMWSRYTADGEITISRGRSGQNFPAWIQAIDLGGVNNQ